MEDDPAGDRALAARVEKLEAVAAVARCRTTRTPPLTLIEPDGREWKDYLALIDALEALRRPSEAADPND